MAAQIAGIGNALMDALVVVEDDAVLTDLGLTRGTMHLVDHNRWEEVFAGVKQLGVTYSSGGSCANTIATAGLLGSSAVYYGQVGNDELGSLYAAQMEDACGGHKIRTAEHPTGKCLSLISAADAERTMLTDLGASVLLNDLNDFGRTIDESKVVHFTGYTFFDGPVHEVVKSALSHAKSAGKTISLDVADPSVITVLKDRMWQAIVEYVDIVFLNEEEARNLTDQDPEQAIHTVAERGGVDTVIVKLGAKGSMVLHKGAITHVDVNKVDAVDTTGAGDAYAGGYLHGFVQGWSPAECGKLASAVAALTVTQIGAVVKDRGQLATLAH